MRSRLAGSLCALLILALLLVVALGQQEAFAQSRIYFTAGGQELDSNNPGSIERVNTDGTGLTTLINLPPGSRPMGIALDVPNGQMYWNDWNFRLTQRANLDGSSVVPIQLHARCGLGHLALDVAGNKIYTTAGACLRRVDRFNLDGTGSFQTLATAGFFPHGIALDLAAGKMYFGGHPRLPDLFTCPGGLGEVWRANLDGTGLQLLVGGLEKVTDVALVLGAGKIYWADARAGKLQRANLDGSNVEDVLTGILTPFGIALELETCEPVEDPDPRTQGFWKRVCAKPHPSGEHELLPLYVDCVNTTVTFADVDSVDDLCDRLNPNPKNDKCKQAEAQFMALLLNVCSGRVATCNCVLDPDLGETTVGDVIDFIDFLLSSGDRTFEDCVLAQSLADVINNGLTLVPCP